MIVVIAFLYTFLHIHFLVFKFKYFQACRTVTYSFPVTIDQIPQQIIGAIVATEDKTDKNLKRKLKEAALGQGNMVCNERHKPISRWLCMDLL